MVRSGNGPTPMGIARVSMHKQLSMKRVRRWRDWLVVVVLWSLNTALTVAAPPEDTVAQRIRLLQSRSAAREAASLQDVIFMTW